ncbi:Low temperature requirement protein LtrA [Micromonospora rhizosphaerae]|uniref:Low temperature requirement protein LtrA n=1 Tax=Micromonospora rhizosphaerae TaxID=568872 RepID=A0A1C6RCW9_9ACTN|nr:low temperature requirement protein A [Micromonospora rhizosphaerae]SCL14936.1 Low temperature requirement protein LtrA [Micromonospora rhizosphaerae]
MTTSGAAKLLRRPEEPRAGFLELFFDLVFVFALANLSHGLVEHLTWREAFQTLVLLLALWAIWSRTAGITDRLDPKQPPVQVLVMATMFGTLVMAAAAPEAFRERGLLFAGVYVATEIGRYVVLVLILSGHDAQRLFLRLLVWSGVSAVPWIAGAVAQDTARSVLWTLAVAVEYAAIPLSFRAPRLGRAITAEFAVSGEHAAERFQQLFIIALGELILITGLTYSGSGFGAASGAATAIGFATTALLWRIYIHRAGQLLAEAIAAASDPVRVGTLAIHAHLVMVAGIIAIAVGDELVIEHPFGHTDPALIAVILGGPALFLAGRALFEYGVFSRVSRNRLIGFGVLAACSPPMILLPPLVVATAAALVLAGIAVSDAARARKRPPEPPSPPR